MVKPQFDVIIIGAGLVGLSCALALRKENLAVALVDRQPLSLRDVPSEHWGQRVYAISPGSAAFLHRLAVWQQIPSERISPIETMSVMGDKQGHQLEFSAYELGERALAWIVEDSTLHNALTESVLHEQGIALFVPVTPVSVEVDVSMLTLQLAEKETLSARLVVGADGVHSWLRSQTRLAEQARLYEQHAIVANFMAEKPHRGRACQWFAGDGSIMAWLPLPDRCFSLVWSLPSEMAQSLLAAPQQLAQAVAYSGENKLGRLELINSPAAYPLHFLHLAKPVAHRVALIGDAAHCIHPLAGQGVNLGFADAHALACTLQGHQADCGEATLLERYINERRGATVAMQLLTDGLWRLFHAQHPIIKWIRNNGLSLVNRASPIKRLLALSALR